METDGWQTMVGIDWTKRRGHCFGKEVGEGNDGFGVSKASPTSDGWQRWCLETRQHWAMVSNRTEEEDGGTLVVMSGKDGDSSPVASLAKDELLAAWKRH